MRVIQELQEEDVFCHISTIGDFPLSFLLFLLSVFTHMFPASKSYPLSCAVKAHLIHKFQR